ncbi:MAG TPA: hypothetical protein VFN97_18890 [Actinospica sp.]|nr:hypothetical protein [Actinospica sp.]
MTPYTRRYLLAHGAYLAVGLALLAWYGLTPGQALARFDGQHYLQIASSGYVRRLTFLADGKPARMNIAFFPLYPWLMAAVHAVTRLPMEIAGLVVSLLAALATAVGLGVLLEPLFGRRTALWTVTIWAVGVDAIVQSMLYAQPVIAAFAVWGAVAIRRRKPLLGAACAIGAGLSHSTGLGLIVVVMAGAALLLRESASKQQWRATLAPAAAFVLAPMGLVGYIAFLAVRFHRADAWFLAESAPGWSSEFDLGKYSAQILTGQLDTTDWFAPNGVPHLVASLWIVPMAAVMLWLLRDQGWWPRRYRPTRSLGDRPPVPWELTVFSLVTFAVILTNSGPWGSKPRFLIPCLALCVPPAIWLGRLDHRPRAQQAIVLGIATVSVLCSAYLVGPSPSAL